MTSLRAERTVKESTSSKEDTKEEKRNQDFQKPAEIKRSRDQEIKRSRDQKLFQGKIQTTSWEGEERS
ncbi:MAG TPA: hypothetical protein H9735_02395 [Candidatus Anaerostipes excrementavium]|uniref:Uncharacterized protein n=1 Tax=Candidatus Anaerostipes excrementavium TaxID=2838463 RepID=A0A9D1WUA3_9FIRM|nr:hypothetical protein [uncultured Anaerostipes sp.]HIX66961.1 hypothetical protein [Candidatus Anaerostipes excrementavium]